MGELNASASRDTYITIVITLNHARELILLSISLIFKVVLSSFYNLSDVYVNENLHTKNNSSTLTLLCIKVGCTF